MNEQFLKDLEIGKTGEQIVIEKLRERNPDYTFTDVSTWPGYYYSGDIVAKSKETGEKYLIEVKNDSRIADTHNVLCEHEVVYYESGKTVKGNMFCNTDFYMVVSQAERLIYQFNFQKLKEVYKQGVYKVIRHFSQETHAFLCSVDFLKEQGALINTIPY